MSASSFSFSLQGHRGLSSLESYLWGLYGFDSARLGIADDAAIWWGAPKSTAADRWLLPAASSSSSQKIMLSLFFWRKLRHRPCVVCFCFCRSLVCNC
ncbi:hypothetical protein DAI22_02g332200 [Oryza sativa Japonica Group]|uniref:Uncharacterized protein n=1 Tax=Oryza glaberrima TaxID=4538 RepID=I1P488_ORYGL|nr:hypothetical protein DAI22_02g332200 [Oryza sativa Japonica Group]